MGDYSRRVGVACVLLILMLGGVSYLPALNVGGVELKRVDILSDIRTPDFTREIVRSEPAATLDIDERDYEIDMDELFASVEQARQLIAQHDTTPTKTIEEPLTPADTEAVVETLSATSTRLEGVKLTPIERFDTTEYNPFVRLYSKLNRANSTVRIALLGDSFVEGDILSGDLREALQSVYGGVGCGFAPFDSPLTRFRRTVKTTSEGWTTYNIMQKRTSPEHLAPHHFVSGWVSEPHVGASTRWEGSNNRDYLSSWSSAKILFMSRKGSTLDVSINGAPAVHHKIQGSETLQQLSLTQDSISSVSVKVTSGAEGFIGYGAMFDSSDKGGVVVDNYSVRSNNGQAILWTNPSVNFQMNHIVGGYDLVILQYGLNIMQKGVFNYTRYSEQVEKIVAYVRECFPSAAVLIMGVSDRSMKEAGVYHPMSEAVHLTKYQRRAAENSGAAFWSTYDAMQAQGGMAQFVKEGWAGKDFTHINFAGGRQIAYALTDALVHDHLSSLPTIKRKEFERVVKEEDLQIRPLNE